VNPIASDVPADGTDAASGPSAFHSVIDVSLPICTSSGIQVVLSRCAISRIVLMASAANGSSDVVASRYSMAAAVRSVSAAMRPGSYP